MQLFVVVLFALYLQVFRAIITIIIHQEFENKMDNNNKSTKLQQRHVTNGSYTEIIPEDAERSPKETGTQNDDVNGEVTNESRIIYGVEDVPPWYATILFGMQVMGKNEGYNYFSKGLERNNDALPIICNQNSKVL